MTDLIIVGEAPQTGSAPPGRAFEGSSGRNLAAIAGWDWDEFLARTYRVNLFPEPVDHWPRLAAWSRADELRVQLAGATPVILCGRNVAAAFGLADELLYRWLHEEWANVARVPHPSGRNRVWNDFEQRAEAHRFLRNLLR